MADTARQRAKARLAAWMELHGKKQVHVAAALNRTQGWVSKQLLSKGPGIDQLDAVAKMMGTTAAALVAPEREAPAADLKSDEEREAELLTIRYLDLRASHPQDAHLLINLVLAWTKLAGGRHHEDRHSSHADTPPPHRSHRR